MSWSTDDALATLIGRSYVQFALRCCESTRTTMTSLSAGIALLEENSTE